MALLTLLFGQKSSLMNPVIHSDFYHHVSLGSIPYEAWRLAIQKSTYFNT
jgi:hypothetical protein